MNSPQLSRQQKLSYLCVLQLVLGRRKTAPIRLSDHAGSAAARSSPARGAVGGWLVNGLPGGVNQVARRSADPPQAGLAEGGRAGPRAPGSRRRAEDGRASPGTRARGRRTVSGRLSRRGPWEAERAPGWGCPEAGRPHTPGVPAPAHLGASGRPRPPRRRKTTVSTQSRTDQACRLSSRAAKSLLHQILRMQPKADVLL